MKIITGNSAKMIKLVCEVLFTYKLDYICDDYLNRACIVVKETKLPES